MFIKRGDKRGANILMENIIFIVLNLVFLAIILLFVFSRMGASAVLEEKYSKQIALIIDAAKPEMIIDLNMEDAVKKANKEGQLPDRIVSKDGNVILVKINPKGKGHSYSYFNDVDVSINYVKGGVYRISIKEWIEGEKK